MREAQSIFIQIAEVVKDRILSGEYIADERIPSVRDIAVELEVNPNTAMKGFELLQRESLIYNKRGIGYFVAPDAKEKVIESRKKRLREVTLPALIHELNLLGLTLENLSELCEQRDEPKK